MATNLVGCIWFCGFSGSGLYSGFPCGGVVVWNCSFWGLEVLWVLVLLVVWFRTVLGSLAILGVFLGFLFLCGVGVIYLLA